VSRPVCYGIDGSRDLDMGRRIHMRRHGSGLGVGQLRCALFSGSLYAFLRSDIECWEDVEACIAMQGYKTKRITCWHSGSLAPADRGSRNVDGKDANISLLLTPSKDSSLLHFVTPGHVQFRHPSSDAEMEPCWPDRAVRHLCGVFPLSFSCLVG
jgi:hypothetical protein